jgi:hypothetical protein
MHTENLLKLADALENVIPAERFDFNSLTSGDFSEGECGSTACAIGWIPALMCFKNNHVGKLYYDKYNTPCLERYPLIHHDDIIIDEGFDVAMTLFDITSAQADYLFDPLHYGYDNVSKETVARRIRECVAKNRIPAPELELD